MPRNFFIYIILVALLVVSWRLMLLSEPTLSDRAAVPEHSPDYFSRGYSKVEMDVNGKPKNRIVADKVMHFSDNDTSELERPVMTLYKPDAAPWIIRSETGTVPAGGRDLYLNGKVNIHRKQMANYKTIIINTSNLHVKPEQEYAETNAWTELIMPPNRTTGIGMQANFGGPLLIKLLADVRGKYE